MNMFVVVGESSSYAERLQWNVDIWPTIESAEARVKQLKELVKQLGWPEAPGIKLTTHDFIDLIDKLNAIENGDPNAVWNMSDLYIEYTVDEVELKMMNEFNCLNPEWWDSDSKGTLIKEL